jgi:hypothetical protein
MTMRSAAVHPNGNCARDCWGRRAPRDRHGAGVAPGLVGRSVADLLATLQELEHLWVGFVSLTEAFDLTHSSGLRHRSMTDASLGFSCFPHRSLLAIHPAAEINGELSAGRALTKTCLSAG